MITQRSHSVINKLLGKAHCTPLLDGRPKLRHLLLIDALSAYDSTVRAAEHLHVTQPAVM